MNNNTDRTELQQQLRLIQGIGFTALAGVAISCALLLMILAFQLNPGLPAQIGGLLSPSALAERINGSFGPAMQRVFKPMNPVLSLGYPALARIGALAFFIGTMVWVFVGLRREYVNLEAPSKKPWHDLRFWTIVSMLPHLVVYFYF